MPETATVSLAGINVFGVRHLSPAGAWHLRRYLDRVKPRVVLIEGLADADHLIADITRKDSVPPIAILAYTQALPVRTLVYPIACYSPEYQALLWAKENEAEVHFIDLPSDVFLGLYDAREKLAAAACAAAAAEEEQAEDELTADEHLAGDNATEAVAGEETSDKPVADTLTPAGGRRGSLYQSLAKLAGEPDYETYWERRFEHNLSDDAYRRATVELGKSLLELEEDTEVFQAENLVREAYMRRRIADVIEEGCPAEQVAVIVGAYHTPALSDEHEPMTDDEFASLPRRESLLTLMPYSYFRLSSQSGYGAGNQAPAYFELLWEALTADDLHSLPARYLSLVARHMRHEGTHRSTAEVIEGVRLANMLSALKGGMAPTLKDLQDAATTLIGHGELGSVAESLARVEVGTSIGSLPQGVSKTSIQDDFERELERLRLVKYRSGVRQEISLDLRENRRVKSEAAAYLDLERSYFLHRLRVLGIGFAKLLPSGQDSATWAERWEAIWTPECEINLVEAVLMGETVELATAYKFKAHLEQCQSVAQAADRVRDACECGMMASMETARQRLQALAAESSELVAVAHAAHQLSLIARYGDVRRFDPAPLMPLIEELFVQGALALPASSNCDNDAAKQVLIAMNELNKVSLELHERVDEELWVAQLVDLSDADDRNPLLSGYACSILLERGELQNEDLAREVSRRLSPGIDADLGAGWFEGLAKRNRYSLLARQPLWEQLAQYVESLEDGDFRRALVFLRRAFGGFSPLEKRHIAENLGEFWGAGGDAASELINQPLSDEEQDALSDLSDFDFDDL